MIDLEKALKRDMVNIYDTAKRELGYNATYFLRMLSDVGPLETARRLVLSTSPSEGFATLYQHRRLDLTVEALVVRDEYAELFEPELVSAAEARLAAHGGIVR